MDQEKDLLKKELGGLEKKEEIEKFAEDAGLLGHEDVVELAKQKLQEISKKAESVEQISESQVSQIGTMGGSIEEANNRTGEVDKKIEEIKTESVKKVEEVQEEKNAMNLEVEINNLNKEAEKNMNESMNNISTPEVKEKRLSKEELTNLLKNNALKLDRLTMGSMKWANPSDENVFFVPKMTWNENSGVIVFSDENGETYATKSSDELRSSLNKSFNYSKNESIGVPAVNDPLGWKDQKFFEYFWKNKHKESYQ